MLQYYLRMEPQLFKAAVDDQLRRLREQKDRKEAEEAACAALPPPSDPSAAGAANAAADPDAPGERSAAELVLYQRMQEVAAGEMRATLEDLL